MTEEQLHSQCFIWHWNTFPWERGMLHHNNNNSHNRISGSKAKAMGVVAGVSDFEYVVENQVVFIEMKTPEGSLSKEQKEFRDNVMSRGHLYLIVRTFERFKQVIEAYASK